MKTSVMKTPAYWTAVSALLLLPLAPSIVMDASAATTRVLEITTATANPTVPFAGFDGNPPKVYDINGDGKVEIIAQNDNQWVYVFDSKTGAILFEVKTLFPPGWSARSFNGPEVSVITTGGTVKLIVANSAATITSYRFDLAGSTTTRFVFIKEWERRLTDCYSNPAMDSKPVLADLDRDGRMEILAQTEEVGVFALRDDGRLFWNKKCIGGGNAEPGIGDFNQDGSPDAVFASDAGIITAVNGRTGGTLWTYSILANYNLHSASIPVGPAVGQLDGVGGPDVVVGARDSHDATDWSQDHALLLALDSQGRKLWGAQDPMGNPLTYTHPIIVDADLDAQPEVYWGDWNTIGHKPPYNEADSWKPTGPANFFRYDAAGNLVWRQRLDTWWSNKDLVLADVDADGVQEVLANGPSTTGHDGIWYLDARNGAKEAFVDVYPYKVLRGPIVADLWTTGTMQWVVPVAGTSPGVGSHGILVYDTLNPYNSAYPHLPYPTVQPPAPPPPPTMTFDATFTIKSPNAWWQEVYVKPATARTIAKVEVRVNDGVWDPMTLRSWGAWTSSYNTPAGTKVEFLATDSGGAKSQSLPFTWMDGTTTKGSTTPSEPPPPPPPTFDATFEVPSSVNEWWVEVKVTASDPVSSVDARVNGGTWIALSQTSWGSWAKSFYVDPCSTVQFRATSSFGAQDSSEDFTWMSSQCGGGGGGPFTATFEPRSQTNNWWVEVKVTSTHKVVKVESNTNDGTWNDLPKTSWGTWAKSYFVADGASVKFRATNDLGETVESGSYVWG